MGKLSDQILEEIATEEEAAQAETTTSSADEPPKVEEATEEKQSEEKVGEPPIEEGGEEKPSESKSTDEPAKEADDTSEKKTEEEPPAPLTFTVKVDGEERTVDQDELVRGYQLAQTSHKRFQEAKQAQKDTKSVLEMIEKNPFGILERIFTRTSNGDYDRAEKRLYDLAIQWLEPRVARTTMSEEERAAHDERLRFQREKQDFEEEQERARQEQYQRAVARAKEKFDGELRTAMDKYKIPNDEKTMRRLGAFLRDEYIDLDIEASADHMVFAFKKERERREAEWKEALPPKGEKPSTKTSTINKATRKDVSTPPFPSTKAGEGEPRERATRKPRAYRTQREFHESMREIAAQG